jgi:hypothetical protein
MKWLLTAVVCAGWNGYQYRGRGARFVSLKTGADLGLLALFAVLLRPIIAALSVSWAMSKAMSQESFGRGIPWAFAAGCISVLTFRSFSAALVLGGIAIDGITGWALSRFEHLAAQITN